MQIDTNALFKIEYGLYVVTSKGEELDNGLILNSVMQVTAEPLQVAITINKSNYSHDIIKETGIMNICALTEQTPFSVFQNFGMKSGKDSYKLIGVKAARSENGLLYLTEYSNAFISLKVNTYTDLGSHGMFICTVTAAETLNDSPTMTYSFYHKNVKPKKEAKTKGYVCKICGYVYEGETLPDDFICPLCKHPASDFEKIE